MIGSILPALQALAVQVFEVVVIGGVIFGGAAVCIVLTVCGPSKDDRPFRDRRP